MRKLKEFITIKMHFSYLQIFIFTLFFIFSVELIFILLNPGLFILTFL